MVLFWNCLLMTALRSRYFYTVTDLYGRNKIEMTMVDMVLDTIVDMRTQLYTLHTEIQKANKAKKVRIKNNILMHVQIRHCLYLFHTATISLCMYLFHVFVIRFPT